MSHGAALLAFPTGYNKSQAYHAVKQARYHHQSEQEPPKNSIDLECAGKGCDLVVLKTS